MTTIPAPTSLSWRQLQFDTADVEVYAPKPASLLLAEWAIERVNRGERVLDACTGSGVVGLAVARHVPGSVVTVADLAEKALDIASRNAKTNGLSITVQQSDLYAAFQPESFDVVTVHPPAVPYPSDADWGLTHGMRIATDGGNDGSELVIRSIVEAKPLLRPGGRLLLLLPHWSHLSKARQALSATYGQVQELARLPVEFFPVREGKPDHHLLEHVRRLAAEGSIEMTFDTPVPLSLVSVVEARLT
jgi:methylase of polypeptide subunit release factors